MNNKKFWFKNFSFWCLSLLLFAFLSCGEDSGLGGAIDTKSPTLSIDYPPSGAAIRDSFILFGNVSDDKSIAKVLVSVKSLDVDGISDNYVAKVSDDSKNWSIELNRHDEQDSKYFNGWQYPDGKYEVYVTAYDNAGNNSGKSSRSFEIDNTAPVFIISNPGVVKKSGLSPSAYGSIFTIDGTISDNHAISFMDVKIFNSDGVLVSSESYEGENIDFYREEEISTAGGTSVQIAQYGTALNNRYSQLHPSDSGTDFYYAQITLTDSTKIYKDPPVGSSRSADEIKSDAYGNATSKIYLYDDVYTSVMSSKKGINKNNGGFSAANLKDILSGLEKGEIESQALEILNEKVIDTSAASGSDSMANKLSFSLNPEANPNYTVNGFSFFNDDDSVQTASAGNTVSVTISAGLDGTNIAPEKVRVWMKSFNEKPSDAEKIKTDLRNLEKKVASLVNSETVFVDSLHKSENSVATVLKTEENENDWLLIYDYSLNNSKGSSVSTKTFSVTLPKEIELSKYYILGVTGCDIEDVEFAQNVIYGFVGNTAGVPPTIGFDSPKNLEVFKDFSAPVFKGTATFTSSMLYLTELKAVLSITDEATNALVGEFSDEISCRLVDDEKIWSLSESNALTFDNAADSWAVDLSKIPELIQLYNEKAGDGVYWLANLTVSGKSSSGHEGKANRSVHIDTVAPKVTVNSAEPRVSDFDGSDFVYLNETVRIKGSIEEQNLEEVSYEILASTDLSRALSSKTDSKYSCSLGKKFSIDEELDTTKITELFASESNPDPKIQVDVVIRAKDSAGNESEYHASGDKILTDNKKLVIYQETDRPKIVLGNASAEIEKVTLEKNFFGPSSDKKLQVSFSDDDIIDEYEIWLYDENGTALLDADSKNSGLKVNAKNGSGDSAGKNPYKFFPQKTSASINYALPSDAGEYLVKIVARDYFSNDLSKTFGEKSIGTFPVAVDSGAPKIEISSPASGSFQNEEISVSGRISKKAEIKAVIYKNGTELKDAGFVISETELVQDSSDSGLFRWQGKAKSSGDGEYSIKITAVDSYGQESFAERTFRCDKTPPVLSITEQPASGYSTSTLVVKGTASDANLKTSALKVSLIPSDETKAVKIGVVEVTEPEDGSNEYKWEATFTNLQAEYTLKVTAEDSNKNASEITGTTFMVDLEGPVLSGEIKAGTSEENASLPGNDGTFFVNGKNSVYIKGKVTDYPSGMKSSAYYSVYENITVNEQEKTVADASKVTEVNLESDGSFTIVVDKSKITKSGAIKAVFFDKAGNYTKTDLLNITFDPTVPKIQSATIADNKDGFTAFESNKITFEIGTSAKSYRNFYINSNNKTWSEPDSEGNLVSHTEYPFAISGVATDNLGLKEVKLELSGAKMAVVANSTTEGASSSGEVKDSFTITDEEKLANWSFEGLDLTGVETGTFAKITITDKAGNTATEEIYIQVDKEKPAARHEYDAKKKDLYFRVGKFDNELSELNSWNSELTALDNNLDKDVGGKYQTGTWGTASTITIRGYWGETGSGVKTIYYKIFNSTATTEDGLKQEIAEKAEDFAKNYATDNNGNFAPLKENITKRVAYSKAIDENGNTSAQAFKEIESSYIAEIPGFDSERNYLLLVAVDNVGNAAIDSLGAAKIFDVKTDVADSEWNSGLAAFSLNVDTVAPGLSSTTTGSVYTNGIASVKVCFDENGTAPTGEVSDSSSGIKSVVLTIEDVKDENNNPVEVSVPANLENVAGNPAKKKWSATIQKDILSKLAGNNNYNVSATAKDVAGNKSSSQIFTLMVDKAAPVVTMVSPAYSESEATAINGRISVKGTTEYEAAPPSRLELYYTTKQPQSGSEEQATSLSSLTKIGSAITDVNKIFSWTFSDFNSYDIFTAEEIAANEETKDIFIIPVVYDVAGNCSIYTESENGEKSYKYVATSDVTAGAVQNYFKYTVDKNTDRPIIKLGNCDVSGTALKSTSKAYGTIEDDDGLDGLKLFYISSAAYEAEETHVLPENAGSTWTQAQIKSGSWEIDSGAEGNFSYYLYAIDSEGAHFWSKAGHSLNQMYVFNGVNEKDSKKSENSGISFSADLNPPEIESLEIAHKSLEATATEGWSAVTETYGPTDKDLYIKLVVSEAIGLAEKSSPASSSLIDTLAIPGVTIDGKPVSANLVSASSASGTKTLSSGTSYSTTFYTFLFSPIDLSASELALSGAKTLKVTVSDKSGFTGQGTIGVTYDNNAPTIKIISPTATISDAVIAATTIKGTAFDDFSAIKKLEYVIPKKNVTYSATEGEWVTIGSTTSTWDIEFDSGSSESVSSLLYYAVNKETYDVKEVADGLGIYRVPFYFRTTDTAGNIAFHKADSNGTPYVVYVNPDGGKPSAWINAPETGITTSGTVTVYGGAMDNISVATVGIQIDADGNGVIDDADYTYLSERKADFGISTTDLTALAASTKEADGTTSKNNWYIKAEGTNSWKVILNTNALADYSGKTTTVSYTESGVAKSFTMTESSTEESGSKYKYLIVRVRAIDGEGNTREYTSPNYVNIDNTAPVFSNVKLVQFGTSVTDPTSNSTPVTEREYVSGMYISNITATNNGTWYLAADVKSKSTITSITAEKQTSETTSVIDLSSDGVTSFVKTESEGVTIKHAEAGTINDTDTAAGITSYYRLLIPLKTSESGMIYAMLKSNNEANSLGEQTIKINIDSTAPTLYTTDGAETEDASTKENLRIKSQQKILGTNLESNSVIENSDGYFQFGDTIKEAGSGLAWLVFYFENDIKGMVYDPMKDNSGTSLSSSKENGKLYINEDNFAALYLTGLARDSETKLTLPSANEHVRKGGLVKIAGTYHTITGVDGTEVTFNPAVSTVFKTVELIYAQVVDHTVTENIITDYNEEDVGTDRIESDDGDGMCEILTQQGSFYNWTAYVDSNNIPDGTTYIRVVAMDEAGNLSHGKIASMVANNRPRLTKVFIGTDLNGNGKFDFDADEGDAPVVSTSNKLRTKSGTSYGEFNYYTAYNTRSGAAQSKVALDSRAFKVIDGLCIVPEFTGGNGGLKYTLTNSTDLTPYKEGVLSSMTSRDDLMNATTGKINNVGKLSLFGNTAITDGDNKNAVAYGISDSLTGASYKDFGGIVIPGADGTISSTTDGDIKNVKVTFFDSTDSTDGNPHANGQWATLVIPVTIKSSDSTVPQPKITPFYWKGADDNSVLIKEENETKASIKGHIELEGALPTDTNLTANLPKVSGKIKIEGKIYDDVRLEAISMSIFGGANTVVANYKQGEWKQEVADANSTTALTLPAALVSFTAVDEDMSQNGHTVKYTAVIDTEKLSVKDSDNNEYPVGKAQWITVGASDWKHNYVTSDTSVTGGTAAFTGGTKSTAGKVQTETKGSLDTDKRFDTGWTNCYQMDVVPYVTEIVTHLSAFYGTAHSVYARTARGHYPCYEGEEIEFKGYNLGSGKAKVVIPGMTDGGDALSEANKITLTATSTGKTGATSGAISLSVNGIPAMNNINNNDKCGSYTTEDTGRAYTDDNYAHCYNRQPNGVNNNTLTDDLELDVWQFKNAAKPVNGGAERVTMKIRPTDGTPGFSYANSVLYFSMPGYNADHRNDTAWRSENGTINGTYASQIPFGMNYGGFSHNSFTFDNQGYSYGAAMCTDTNNASQSAFFQFFSKETPLRYNVYDQNMNYANEANASRLDSSTMNVGTYNSQNWQCNINRIQSISMETSNSNGTSAATDASPVYVFMAYYDAIVKQVRFRWGTVGGYSDSIDGKTNNNAQDIFTSRKAYAYGLDDIHDSTYTGRAEAGKDAGGCRPSSLADSFVKYSNTNNDGIPIQVIAGSGLSYSGTHNSIYNKMTYTAGQYVSLSILEKDTATPTACVFWYDGSKLMMAYNSSPTTGKTWTYKTVDTDGGLHVKSAVDSDGGIHLAYYTSNGGNLKYAYLSGVTASPQIATVDANGAVGTKCTIDVAKNADGKQVPYITYQMIGGVYTYNAKIAYRTNFTSTTVPNGADSKDMFTGDWEVSVIPTESSRLLKDDTINVGLWRDENGAAKPFSENAYWKASDKWFDATVTNSKLGTVNGEDAATGVSNGTMDTGNPSLIYGNNTANPIIGYGIESGAIEIAQKK
ncbi:MAG: hypothetical protein SPL22_10560 [Treponema sp.]|uniref:hypothetical protein n=1 Tax=Treponema sp. TaxID=166 RepID=UPI002A9167D4|nr:hypothetical protein [Treponema sp.]MDY6398158.1 hypothetical protein [Treponema sp.]